MKKNVLFFAKCILVLVLLVVFCFGAVMPQYTLNYQAALLDKHARLMSIDEPKIVLVGNSNLVFGMDSAMVEEAMGMPVVNMGMHGGLGNPFNEQAAVQNLHPGDIVILSYSNFDDKDVIKNQELAWITIEDHFELYSYVRKQDWPDMIRAYPTYLKDCLTLWADGTGNMDSGDEYSRTQFNEYGDNIYDRPGLVPGTDLSEVHIPAIGQSTVDRINALNDTVTAAGATLLITAYPTPITEQTAGVDEYAAFSDEIDERIDAPLISRYEDYMMDASYFYNTYLHLNNEGVKVRTEMFIEDLHSYLQY
ncbi:MAG: hypothetical protein K6G07_06675 [Lachnospiraceae bacterium]|nr:hypothetical protein [Lachnospiraceae bacterium]